MANRYATLAATLLVAGATGTSLYTASTAQEARTAISAAQHVTTTHGDLAVHVDAGLARLAVGTAGQVLAVSDAGLPHWAPAPSSGPTTITYYASDFVAENGGASGAAASISGTGSTSTATITIGTTGSYHAGTGPRVVLSIPAGATEIELTVRTTATSGTGDTWKYLGFALRDAPNAGAPSTLWGVGFQSHATSGAAYAGGLQGGLNTGTGAVSLQGSTQPFAADRYLRARWRPRDPFFHFLTGAGSAGVRPSLWYPPSSMSLPGNSPPIAIPDNVSTPLGLAVFAQGFGGSGSITFTAELTVRVTSS